MLSSERLLIQPTSEEDAVMMYELMNTPSWLEYIGDRNIRSVDDAKSYIRSNIISQYERLGYSSFTISLALTNEKIGVCGLYDRESVDGIDLGFALFPQFAGQGFAFEACRKLMEAARDKFSLEELSAITSANNVKSKSLLKKLGFSIKKDIQSNGDSLELWHIKLK